MVVLDPAARADEFERGAPWPRWAWIVTPLLFALWVNLHSSVYIGFAILAEALGRLVEVAWNERRLPALWHDRRLNRWILLGLLAAAGALLNPQGPGVVVETARLAGNPNLRTVSEWLPMTTTSVAGRLFAGSWAILFVISRLSQRRVRPVEVILLGGFSVGVLQTGRMIAWYVPVYVFVIMPHVAEIVSRRWPASPPVVFDPVNLDALPSGRSFRYTLFCAATIWAALALSHLTDGLLGAEPRPASSLYHRDTPRWASTSRIIRPLVRSGTRRCWAIGCCGRRCATTNRRWRYSRIATCTSFPDVCGWNIKRSATCVPNRTALLARYQVSTLVVGGIQHPLFVAELHRAADWTIVYETHGRRGDAECGALIDVVDHSGRAEKHGPHSGPSKGCRADRSGLAIGRRDHDRGRAAVGPRQRPPKNEMVSPGANTAYTTSKLLVGEFTKIVVEAAGVGVEGERASGQGQDVVALGRRAAVDGRAGVR